MRRRRDPLALRRGKRSPRRRHWAAASGFVAFARAASCSQFLAISKFRASSRGLLALACQLLRHGLALWGLLELISSFGPVEGQRVEQRADQWLIPNDLSRSACSSSRSRLAASNDGTAIKRPRASFARTPMRLGEIAPLATSSSSIVCTIAKAACPSATSTPSMVTSGTIFFATRLSGGGRFACLIVNSSSQNAPTRQLP